MERRRGRAPPQPCTGPGLPDIGFFATGLTELPAGAAPDTLPAAVISRERAKHLAEYLEAPAGLVLQHLGRTSHG
ncbi:hypothetical protein [Streptomyces nigra]